MAVDTGRPRACRSVEHGGLRLHKPVPDGLEVQPADLLAADMLAAITRAFRYHQPRRDARGVNHQLLLAATLQRNEPKRGGFDAVPACRKQSKVLMDRRFHALEPDRDFPGPEPSDVRRIRSRNPAARTPGMHRPAALSDGAVYLRHSGDRIRREITALAVRAVKWRLSRLLADGKPAFPILLTWWFLKSVS